ncbi:Three-deoxy-D-manno-octulosonic-acid transferase domain protein [Pirellula staleyi DSM 6068]|uniref:3-deoxy-D-manno-octulosonic acid transferase n=1 Tax=Pirellula staleyi (strain ATCC 27377 / DSM 6068 / ICPB 4128) TaxID=530564 RepID=D2R3W6_PIRSD|nr:3-deoxy-D-manno-octulosonic acid transferase [Pirellula staleyi]ADB18815.1 Three-deoxy-D-manno-octulosonic-acid transferase domain protein [Pirellula staleyi DSM 6068]
MPYLLNVLYLAVIALASPYLLWHSFRSGKYREGFYEKLLGLVPRRESRHRCLWLHAVSVGEVNLLMPIVERWERLHPDWEIVISTTTATGFALAHKRYAPRMVFYCPLDFTWSTAQAMHRIRPDLLVLTELELWPNLIRAARRSGVKVAVINGRLSEKSFRGYSRVKRFLASTLQSIDTIAAQNEEYASRFRALGANGERVCVTGSIKFDGAQLSRENPRTQSLARLAGITAGDHVFLAGSTQAPEEEIATSIYLRLRESSPQLKLILVPRHPERFEEVARMLTARGVEFVRRSQLDPASSKLSLARRELPAPRVILVDAVGELGSWWGTARAAFVGGSLGKRGGQNMIEPAAYGCAVAFGPNTWNFRDVVSEMLAHDAAVVVQNEAELDAFVQRTILEPGFAAEIGARAHALVKRQVGAADRTIGLLESLILPNGSTARAA